MLFQLVYHRIYFINLDCISGMNKHHLAQQACVFGLLSDMDRWLWGQRTGPTEAHLLSTAQIWALLWTSRCVTHSCICQRKFCPRVWFWEAGSSGSRRHRGYHSFILFSRHFCPKCHTSKASSTLHTHELLRSWCESTWTLVRHSK